MVGIVDDPISALRQYHEAQIAGEHGESAAVRWAGVDREVTLVRKVGRKVAEVYESVRYADGGQAEWATVLRRSRAGWTVESEAPAVPDTVVLLLLLKTPPAQVRLDRDRYNRDHRELFGAPGTADRVGDDVFAVRCSEVTAEATVVPAGPAEYLPQHTACQPEFYRDHPEAITDELIDEADLVAACSAVRSGVVLSAALPPDTWSRAVVLGDLADAGETLLRQLDVSVVVPGGACRQLTPHRFAALNRHTRENEFNSFPIWCGVHRIDDHLVTHGLRWYALPELEIRPGPDADAVTTARQLAAVGLSCLQHGQPRTGTLTGRDGTQTHLAAGRLGPTPDSSYGRWGSLAVAS